jgi:DeoR family transcriptional regulator of aga operon
MSTLGQRRKHILEHIRKDGFVKVSELADALGVTQTTIRKDLKFLEAQGVLQRAHGSAISPSQQIMDINLSAKKLINFEAKQKIAQKAASLIEADDSILIASGSTITLFAEALKPKGRLNVVSISVNISAQLGDVPGITVMQVGGILYTNTFSVLGAEASNTIENLFCSKVFFGVDGIDLEYGLTCGTGEEARITKKMMQSSQTKIVLSDSSKIGQRGFARICEVEEIDILITDSGISEEARQRIEKLGIKLIIAD